MFSVFLVAAAVCDLRARRIPNALTAACASVGLFMLLLNQTQVSLSSALLACVLALVAGIVMQWMRLMGGGDVKLFAASALWLGSATFDAALATAVAGGVLAAFYLRSSARSVQEGGDGTSRGVARLQLDDQSDAGRVPYGVAIAVGCLWTWFDGSVLIGRFS